MIEYQQIRQGFDLCGFSFAEFEFLGGFILDETKTPEG